MCASMCLPETVFQEAVFFFIGKVSRIFRAMNFLAHLYLSGNENERLKIGNFIGDQVSGNKIGHFHPDIQKGIKLHRAIDTFTDDHPVTLQGRTRLYNTFHKYAGVITDVYHDHFLAKYWNQFSDVPLEIFAHETYLMLEKHKDELPPDTKHMLGFMKQENWLLAYSTIEGISSIFVRMSKRTRFESHMELAGEALRNDYAAFEADFYAFFPELQAYCAGYIKELFAEQ